MTSRRVGYCAYTPPSQYALVSGTINLTLPNVIRPRATTTSRRVGPSLTLLGRTSEISPPYNAEKVFGIHLVHDHFQIPEGTVMVGTNFQNPNMR